MDERLRDAPDAEATIALPAPGGRRTPYAHLLDRHAAPADVGALGGLNPLVEAANPILAAVPQIRHALRHPDPPALRARLRHQIGSFERSAKAAGATQWQLATARFALCAVIDDSAAATPWGRDWGSRGLLVEIEREASGAEKFFVLLDDAWAKPEENRHLLELFSVCLALGFEGRYRGGETGRQALSQLRSKLFGALWPDAGTTPELSAHWRGADVRPRRVPGALALWAATGACAFVLAALYFGYSTALGVRSDPVARELALLRPVALAGTPPAIAPRAGPSLSATLAEAIGRREVSVSDTARGVRIVLRSDELFASGSARLNAALHPVVDSIAAALDGIPGTIMVTGHTDDVPIRTARFPSNWELSTERAGSVVTLLSTRLRDPARLRAEGLADAEPLVPNDGAANRARNRRVEIVLRTTP
jgi:type VI secretion system protein ImpK